MISGRDTEFDLEYEKWQVIPAAECSNGKVGEYLLRRNRWFIDASSGGVSVGGSDRWWEDHGMGFCPN